jgi:hypothetical protein
MKTKRREPLRETILQDIFEHFQQITQWTPNHSDSVFKYASKAESLIEILEGIDCGSYGGYDKSNPLPKKCKYHLYDRFLALLNKYNHKVEPSCGFTIEKMCEYFNNIHNERDKILGEE